jgi:hypothetical protein
MVNASRRSVLTFTLLLPIANVALAMGKKGWARADERPLHPGPNFFVKGVYQQPLEKMADWKGRGVNTIFTMNSGGDLSQWTNEAMKHGLYVVREPAGIDRDYNLTDRTAFEHDVANPSLLAVALVDEPSNLRPGGAGITYQDVAVPPEQLDIVAHALSAGGKPLWINHVGNHINNIYLEKIMSDYADSADIDWLGQDCYPISSGTDLVIDLDDYASTPQGHAIDRLSRWSGGRPQFSFVALTQYDASKGRKTTPEEFRVQVWSSIIHGAIGIIYFTFKFSPEFSYDATPDDLLMELKQFHSQIDEIDHVLVDKIKGGRRPAVVLSSVRDGESGGMAYPFEACSTQTDGGEYKIILNLANEPATLTYEPWGLSNVTFAPYQCKRGYAATDFDQS